MAQLRFLKGSLVLLFLWPLLSLVVGCIMWHAVQSQLAEQKQQARDQAFQEVQSLAQSYREQLARTVAQIDQITANLAYYWQQSKGTLVLRDQAGLGLYPDDPNFSAAITDREGMVLTSLLSMPGRVTVSDRPYFLAQKNGPAAGLQFAKVGKGRITGKPNLLLFNRRMNDAHGRFDGIALVGLSPTFLTSYYFNAKNAETGSLTVFDREGELIASSSGSSSWVPGKQILRKDLFSKRVGVLATSGDIFADERSRIVAWDALENYPFVAVAALPEDRVYAQYEASRTSYMAITSFATIFLAIAGIAGAATTARLAWRKQQAATISDTYRLATDGAREGFFMARALYSRTGEVSDFVVENCNEQGAQMFGFTKEQMLNVRFSAIFQGRELTQLMATFSNAMQSGFVEDEFRIKRPQDIKWIHRRLVRAGDGVAITLRDVTSEKAQEQRLQQLANTDALTSLPNRHWLSQNLPKFLQAADEKREKAAVLYLDLDNFKDVNNTLGHDAGDLLLRQAAQRIKGALRPGDQVVRLGGDEFTVILPSIATPDDAILVSDRIQVALSRPMQINGCGSHTIRASVGIGMFPENGDSADTLLRHADTAMYAAKNAGKGNYAFYSARQTEQIVKRLSDEAALRDAVLGKQFVLHYQPRVDAVTGKLLGLEALVRWMHTQRGIVPPLDFIPLAEETGLIVEIGEFVVQQACAQIAIWQKELLNPVSVAVNVSAIQFERCDVKAVIERATAFHNVAPGMLEIEITESCMMHDSKKVSADIAAIKSLGVRVSVDDFGTGYSSLAQLQKMDLDILKVDRAFTMELTDGKHGTAFFKTIISMAHMLGMKVVAEGVETLEQLTTLQALGCDDIQGYYISKPVAAEAVPALLARGSLLPVARTAHETA